MLESFVLLIHVWHVRYIEVIMNRREALKKFYNIVIAVGASSFFSFEDLLALESKALKKPNIIWLQGSSCTGCSLSLINIEDISFTDFIFKFVNIIYHPNLSFDTDHSIEDILNDAQKNLKDDYLLVVEGSIPTLLPHACLFADVPFIQWTQKMATNAHSCIAVGTCATFGGITDMKGIDTGASSLLKVLHEAKIDKPIINLPNCPLRPEHFVYTILYLTKFGTLPPLDTQYRPKEFFSKTVHQNCIHYNEFQEDIFATDIGEEGCLFELGCQGPVTKNDCMVTGFNGTSNNCIKAGHPCIGCAGEHFPRQIMFHSYDDERVITPFKKIYFEQKK